MKNWIEENEQYYTIEEDTLKILREISVRTNRSVERIADMLLKDAAENLWRKL